MGNLNKNITEEDLNQLFGLKTTVYLRQTCSIEMPLDKNTGKSKGFAFLNVPQHVYNELVKLNGIEFQNHFIRIEEARTTKQTRGVPLNKQNRPNPTIMSKVNNVVIFVDSIVNFNSILIHFNRQIKNKINKGLQSGRAQCKYFPGATSKDLLHYIDRTLEDHSFEVVIIHIGVNDIISNRSSTNFDHVLKNIKNIVRKCRSYGIENIFISGLLQATRIISHVIGKVKVKVIFVK